MPGNIFTGILDTKEFAQRLPGRVNNLLVMLMNNGMSINVDTIDKNKLMTRPQKVAARTHSLASISLKKFNL